MENFKVLGYKVEINKNDEGNYIARIPQLGCIADGKTIDETIDQLREVAQEFLRLAKEEGKLIPTPDKD